MYVRVSERFVLFVLCAFSVVDNFRSANRNGAGVPMSISTLLIYGHSHVTAEYIIIGHDDGDDAAMPAV